MTAVTFPSVQATRQSRRLYHRLSDVSPTDHGQITFKLGNNPSFKAYASPSWGGGWVLICQYVHQGGTNPALRNIAAYTDLPMLSPTVLGGSDAANNTYWGCIVPAALLAFPDATADLEFRFFGQTSAHARVINFKTDSAVISRFRDNVGTMLDVNKQYVLLAGHTANLPRATNTTANQQSLTEFPFYVASANHWGIRGAGSRWEVDDFPGNSANSTIHQIWVRYKPGSTLPLVTNGYFNLGNVGWTLSGNVVYNTGLLAYSSNNSAVNGIASQVCQTEPGGMYTLQYTIGRNGSCALATARITAEVRDNATGALLGTLISQPAGATYSIQFTARGSVLIRFIDATTNTTSCDATVSGVNIS